MDQLFQEKKKWFEIRTVKLIAKEQTVKNVERQKHSRTLNLVTLVWITERF